MDITQALRDAENALRDFIAATLEKSLGAGWLEKCGVSEEKLKKWDDRKKTEAKRQRSGAVEERGLYYADFYDLKEILKKNWESDFKAVFGDWKTLEVWLTELEKYRDPDAHRRELLPHQKNLVIGISGEIRNQIVRYRSRQESLEDYYPRIESARDSFGNIWTPGSVRAVSTKILLRLNDEVGFVVTASDPKNDELDFGILINNQYPIEWQKSNSFSFRILELSVRKLEVAIYIKSPREYRANDFFDDFVVFYYSVLPPKE
ncbi:MAG: hypothetical protein KY445_09145 [Armatimonadetes bacterium]|nr:hypothetical protein [Armatimonadota bacterium]